MWLQLTDIAAKKILKIRPTLQWTGRLNLPANYCKLEPEYLPKPLNPNPPPAPNTPPEYLRPTLQRQELQTAEHYYPAILIFLGKTRLQPETRSGSAFRENFRAEGSVDVLRSKAASLTTPRRAVFERVHHPYRTRGWDERSEGVTNRDEARTKGRW